MLAPAVADLRPGDAVKVRGTGHPAHTGGKAVVSAVYRSRTRPGAVDAVEVRYKALGAALRIEIDGPGEMVRFGDPWPAPVLVQREPVSGGAYVGTPPSRRSVAIVLAGVAVIAALLVLWPRGTPPAIVPGAPPTGAVAVVAADDTVGGDGTVWSTASPTTSPTPTPVANPAANGKVVAWSTGPVPVIVLPVGDPSAVPLAGIAETEGCHDAYAEELLRLLPTGTAVEVRGAGYLRTADGVDVNAYLVHAGVAQPAPTPAATSAPDREGWAAVTAAAAPSPTRCR